MVTGYAANTKNSSKVHVFSQGKALCGYTPHDTMKIQWCAKHIRYDYIECEKCKLKARKILDKTIKQKRTIDVRSINIDKLSKKEITELKRLLRKAGSIK